MSYQAEQYASAGEAVERMNHWFGFGWRLTSVVSTPGGWIIAVYEKDDERANA